MPGDATSPTRPISSHHAVPRYRSVLAVPERLHEHCVIYCEEGLYPQALSLLSNLLASGSSTAISPSSKDPDSHHDCPTFIPSSAILSLLATLVVHPAVTIHSHSAEKHAASNQSLALLSVINIIAGPVNAEFSKAFTFVEKKRRGKGRNSSARTPRTQASRQATPLDGNGSSDELSDEESSGTNDISNRTLRKYGSLWECAEDFWHIVGWTFNCAAKFPARWARWKLLLDLMLQILEDDWRERTRLHQEQLQSEPNCSRDVLLNSVAARFLANCCGSSNGASRRRVMRSIFANGSERELGEFRKIFEGETKKKKRKSETPFKSSRRVDIEAGEFGDYYDEAGSDDADHSNLDDIEGEYKETKENRTAVPVVDAPPAKKPGRPKRATQGSIQNNGSTSKGSTDYGGSEAMTLRRRLLILLSRVALALPESFTELSDYVDALEEYVRPLPLDVYSFLICPLSQTGHDGNQDGSSWPPEALIALLQELARQLVPPSAPRNRDNHLTQDGLQKYYLPFAARSGSPVDNAKFSILVENMTRLLRTHVGMDHRDGEFGRTVESGIEERIRKVQANKPKSGLDETSMQAQGWLKTSSARLRVLAVMVGEPQRAQSS